MIANPVAEQYTSIVVDKIKRLSTRFGKWIRDVTRPRHTKHLCVVADLFRSKTELVAENTLLRQQLIVWNRRVARKCFGHRIVPREHILFVKDLSGVLGANVWTI